MKLRPILLWSIMDLLTRQSLCHGDSILYFWGKFDIVQLCTLSHEVIAETRQLAGNPQLVLPNTTRFGPGAPAGMKLLEHRRCVYCDRLWHVQ
jgi:hypothetical protein